MTNGTASAFTAGGSSGTYGIYNHSTTLTMTNVTASGSGADGGCYGVYNRSSSATIENSVISSNGGASLQWGIGSFDLGWHVVSGGGAPASSSSFAVDGSVSQWASGAAESETYQVEAGYWAGPVSCVVSGDVTCDCQVDIGDVQLVANLWRCERGDDCYNDYVDLDGRGGIDVVDIMRVVAEWGKGCS
jgi:hypothetical protein